MTLPRDLTADVRESAHKQLDHGLDYFAAGNELPAEAGVVFTTADGTFKLRVTIRDVRETDPLDALAARLEHLIEMVSEIPTGERY